jgi:hypothetical protein
MKMHDHQGARSTERHIEHSTAPARNPEFDVKCHVWGFAFLRDALIMVMLVAGTVLVTACGGGGAGSGSASSGTGTVALLFTDLPTDEFDQILVDVREIRLLSDDDGQITIFEDSTPDDSSDNTINLLDLQTHATLFAVAENVPVGNFNKIRLLINSIELVKLDDPDTVPDEFLSIPAKLPANGKIDLNPRGGFTLAPGQTLLIELDMDANRSIQYHRTGNGEWRFRPVVFIDIAPQGLVRISGTVTMTEPDLIVCQGAADDELCVTIDTTDASLFGPDGMPLVGDIAGTITAIGFLSAGETEGELVLDAQVVQIGPMYERVAGTVDSVPGADNGTFSLLVDTGPLTVQLQPSTRLFNRQGEDLGDFTAITMGQQADIDGVRDAMDANTLWATLVILDTAAAVTPVTGTVAAASGGQLTVITDTGDRCVNAGASDVFTVAPDSNTEGDAGDIDPNETVEAYGTENSDGCLSARTVIVTAD